MNLLKVPLLFVVFLFLKNYSYSQTFTQVTSGSIVTDNQQSYGCSWGDYNNDGYEDLFVANYNRNSIGTAVNYLYKNNGDGSFTKITSGSLVTTAGNFQNGTWGDYDNDGYLDLFIANYVNTKNYLFHNNSGSSFSAITSGNIVNDLGYTTSSSWVDIDNDGDLDLFATNSTSGGNNPFYMNNGDGTFTSILSGNIATDGSRSQHCSWADYDNDGDQDLFLVKYDASMTNHLYRNDGGGIFTQITSGDPVAGYLSSFTSSWGDYNNDGFLDLFVGNAQDNNCLYKNNGNGTFTKITTGAIVSDVTASSVCSSWIDYDNDGFLDLYVLNDNDAPNYLYKNNGDETFTKITGINIVTGTRHNHGVAWGDYNKDGFPDLFLSNEGTNLLFSNGGNSNHWLNVKLVGVISNKSAIGAKVRVYTNGLQQLREISGQSSLWGQNSLNAMFGLGTYTNIDSIIVEWPSGMKQKMNNVSSNQFLTITEYTVEPPTSLSASASSSSISLSWTASVTAGITDYIIFRSTSNNSSSALPIDTVLSVTSYTDLTISSDVTYYYWIKAIDNNQNKSNFSNSTSAMVSLPFASFTGVYAGDVPGSNEGSIDLGDFDNDGDLDILLIGKLSSTLISKIFQNTGSGFTEVYSGSLTGVFQGDCKWGDYDNDGDLDIAITGSTNPSGLTPFISKIYSNTGSGFSEVFAGAITPMKAGELDWGDYDKDGDLDLVISGVTTSGTYTKIYNNTGNSFIEVYANTLDGAAGPVSWGDYDNDGDLDILSSGFDPFQSSGVYKTNIFKNTGNGFSKVYAGSLAGAIGNAVWGDYDNDGDLDILLNGSNSASSYISKIYQNTGSGFTEVYAGVLTSMSDGDAVWGDLDNDGRLDIIMAGSTTPPDQAVKVYRNTGSGFIEKNIGINFTNGILGNSIAVGDFNNDNKIDILFSDPTSTKLYENTSSSINSIPSPPSGLSAILNNSTVTLSWSKGSDNETPQSSLTYNLFLGRTTNNNQKVSAMSDLTNGYRRIPLSGNTGFVSSNFNITNLEPGDYYWGVQTVDNSWAGSSFVSGSTFVVPVGPPPGLTATAGDMQVSLNWASYSGGGITDYNIYRNTSNNSSTAILLTTIAVGTTSYLNTGLTNGQTYYYWITSKTSSGESSFSSSVSATPADITPPASPTNLLATAGDGKVTLSWNANTESDLNSYKLYRNTSNNISSATLIQTIPAGTTSYINTGLTNGQTYYYWLKAIDNSGNLSSESNMASGKPIDMTAPSAPVNLTATAGESEILLVWNPNSETDLYSYKLYISLVNDISTATLYQTVLKGTTSYIITGLTDGNTYYCWVKAVDNSGNISVESNMASATPVDQTPPAAPSNLSAVAGDGQVSLSWNSNLESDLNAYKLYVNTSNNFGTASLLQTIAKGTTSYINTGLTNGQTYYYWLKAIDNSGNLSTVSNLASAKPVDNTPPAASTNLIAVAGDGEISLSWNSNTEQDLDSYIIYVNIINDFSSAFALTYIPAGTTTETLSGLVNGDTYYFWVQAMDNSGNGSPESNVASATPSDQTPPAAPSNLIAVAGDGQVSLSWNPNSESDLDDYKLYSNINNDFGTATLIQTIPGWETHYTNTGLTNGQTYYYWLQAADSSGNISVQSNMTSATPVDKTPPVAPSNLSAVAGDAQISLYWDSNFESDLSAYKLYSNTNNNLGTATLIQTIPYGTTSYVNTGLTNGQTYYYWLKAEDNSGNLSLASNLASAVPLDMTAPAAPTNLTTIPEDQKVVLIWDANNEFDLGGYIIYRSTTNDPLTSTVLTSVNKGTTSYIDNAVINGTEYFYWMKAFDNASNMSAFSSGSNATPVDQIAPAAPQNLNAFAGTGQTALIWDANMESDLNGYQIFRSNTNTFSTAILITAVNKNTTSYVDHGLGLGTYYYWLKAIDNSGNVSAESNPANVTIQLTGMLNAFPFGKNVVYSFYPNPFSESTVIHLDLNESSIVSVKIYSIEGKEIISLINQENFPQGEYDIQWDGKESSGGLVGAGIYYCKLSINNQALIEKVVVAR